MRFKSYSELTKELWLCLSKKFYYSKFWF